MRVPVLPHHAIVFVRVLHETIHAYLRRRMTGRPIDIERVLEDYRKNWVNEGFISREHEELRKAAGERALAGADASGTERPIRLCP